MSAPVVGQTYKVRSRRKGAFTMTVTNVGDTFATGIIVSGQAQAMLPENEREAGEEVTVRIEFCTFELVDTGAPAEGRHV